MISIEPENNVPHALFEFADYRNKRILEIGCRNDHLNLRYADKAAHLPAIEPGADQTRPAKDNRPDYLAEVRSLILS